MSDKTFNIWMATICTVLVLGFTAFIAIVIASALGYVGPLQCI